MSDRQVITIDGLAGSGKSSIAAQLARRLGFVHFNSGLLYRAVAFGTRHRGISVDEEATIVRLIGEQRFELIWSRDCGAGLLIDGVPINVALVSTPEISEATSLISRHSAVRDALLDAQRQAFVSHDLVAEGRDMGTVVFPSAALKFFVQANVDVRIGRRLAQLGMVGGDLEEHKKNIEREILARDQRDSSRAVAPTVAARDAILIDNSSRALTEVVENMYSHALAAGINARI